MLDEVLQDIYLSKLIREEFKELEDDEKTMSTKDKILNMVDENQRDQLLKLYVQIESRIIKLAYKKGLMEGMELILELRDKPAIDNNKD